MNYCYQIPKCTLPAVRRIVVIGDIHGDLKALVRSLRLARVINRSRNWIGGATHLVQVGDLLDRGGRPATSGDEKSEHKILKMLFRLQREARASGGDVHILLGNHELMNVMGNFRYVTRLGMSDFGGDRQAAFKPGGPMAKQLACNTNSILKIGKWLFAHAGILPNISKKHKIEKVNEIIRNFLLGNTKLSRNSEIMDMFWHRKYSSAPAQCAVLSRALTDYDSNYMVVGHSVQYNGINSDCGGALWRVDVGMSDAFGSAGIKQRPRLQVLEILHDGKKINVLK